jgi:hypothetical protein
MVPTLSEAMTVADSIDVSTKVLVETANIATFRSSLYEMYRKVERSTVAELLRCDQAPRLETPLVRIHVFTSAKKVRKCDFAR